MNSRNDIDDDNATNTIEQHPTIDIDRDSDRD